MSVEVASLRVELRDFGPIGVELQLYVDDEFASGRHYETRELALRDAEARRERFLKQGWTDDARKGWDVMEATGKLRDLARRFTAHQRECTSALSVAMTPLAVDDDASIELICSRCATSFIETFTRDETRQLRDAGIVTDDDVRQFVATTAQDSQR